jgi:RNA polymerase sigma-70 factor (ECF subfamily)
MTWMPSSVLPKGAWAIRPGPMAARAFTRLDTLHRGKKPGGRARLSIEPTPEIIDRARSGDPDAFATLFEAYAEDVIRVCRRMLGDAEAAADARSDVFLKVRRALAGYDPERPFRAWLLSITSHHCIDHLRRRATERRIFAELELEPSDLEGPGETPLSRLLARENRDQLDHGLAALPLEYRLPLLMRYYADASYDEIAESLGTSRSRVGSLIFRAKKLLRRSMTRAPLAGPGSGGAAGPAGKRKGGGR